MTRNPAKYLSTDHRAYTWGMLVTAALAVLGVGLGAPSGAHAQIYNPEDGEELLEDVVVTLEGGERVNDSDSQIGTIGVQQCRDLEGGSVTFKFNLNPNYRGTIELEDGDEAYLMEFSEEDGPGTCNRDETTGCKKLDEELNNITITESTNTVTVDIGFERLRDYVDGIEEPCGFPTLMGSGAAPTQPLAGDAGMFDGGMEVGVDTGMSGMDAGMDTGTDTGTTPGMDTSGGTPDTGTGPSSGANRAYVVRLFLMGEQQDNFGQIQEVPVLADAALELDRTRPAPPANLDAAASENQLKVQFELPGGTDDVEDYHAFFAGDPIDRNATPEELDNSGSVQRRQLKSVQEKDDGTFTGVVDQLSRDEGSTLYVGVATRDAANNFSTVAFKDGGVTVQKSTDFWEKYLAAGGSEGGGCGCGSTVPYSPVGALGVFLLGAAGLAGWRRRRRSM